MLILFYETFYYESFSVIYNIMNITIYVFWSNLNSLEDFIVEGEYHQRMNSIPSAVDN